MFSRKSVLVVLAMLPCLALGADEGPEQGPEGVEEILVTGRYLSIDKMNAVKTPTPVIDVPQSLSIISGEQIERQAFSNFGDILRYTPGLSISQGEGHRDAIIIRGIQTTADFYLDGIRDDVQYYRPLYNLQQVEVLRGANALLFGRGGGGGVVNRVTKQPLISERFTDLNGGADSFGSNTASIDANLPVSMNAAFRFNAYRQAYGSHRDFFDGDSFALNPTLKAELGEATTALLSYELIDSERVVDRGVPSMNVEGGPDVPLKGFQNTFFGSPDMNTTTLEASILKARLDHEFSDRLRGNVTLLSADYDKAYQNLYASGSVTVAADGTFPEVRLDGYRDTTERGNLILQGNLVGEFTTGAVGHTLLFGIEYGSQNSKNDRLNNGFAVSTRCPAHGEDEKDGAPAGTPNDLCTVPFGDPLEIPAFGFTSINDDTESDVRFTSIYLQDQLSLSDNFKVVLGLRHDSFDMDAVNIKARDEGSRSEFSRKDQELTPRLGAIYKPRENVSFYVSYSETFLPRSGDQFASLNLDTESTRPQFFENTEGGLKWDIRPDLSLTMALFQLDRESYTSVDPEDAAKLLVIEGSEVSGFEIQLAGALTERWSVITGYGSLDGRVRRTDGSGNNGNKTRQTPDGMFSLWNNIRINDRLSLGLGAAYQDAFFVNEDNKVEVPGFFRVDAGLYYDISDSVSLQLNIENLLDEEYFPDAHSNNNITTGEPLNARLSIKARF